MCPACILTIGGGLLIAKKLGINDVLAIGLLTVIFSLLTDFTLRKINRGKVFSPYQRILVSIVILIITIIVFKLL
ncbi:MAG: hypothetical protein WC744_05115 [Patescibacteria group bacterium]|jgi:hypothetical protein